MVALDYIVIVVYFLVLIGIGVMTSMRIKKQEDYFMGGRSFGKLLQTFAAFGAGTGSSDPVNASRTTFTSGMSGMWSVMLWLFVTPFYWITGVWYRRMRHLTLGDWFVERYESQRLGVAYAIFGILFFMVYGSMFFSAIGKVAAPLVGFDTFVLFGNEMPIENLLVPLIGLIVLIYGMAGGLEAAYYTDLIQGLCIILLSLILIPFGLQALVDKFGPDGANWWLGFKIMHEQIPKEHFSIIGSTSTSEFPLHRIVAVVLINLVGIVVQPHFIATGGGSAKDENSARIGLVVGNFLKRFCTIGWVLTALIALALFADHPELVNDPDKTWGVASRELLGPGLRGLMLACLLAALMSSVDAYMVVGSALVVRNIYAPYFNAQASEKEYINIGRLSGIVIVGGSVIISLLMMNMLKQLELTWVFPVLFAAPFWVGMYWRRATTAATWVTVSFCILMFFIIPFAAPRIAPGLTTNKTYLTTNQIVLTKVTRKAAPTDVAMRETEISLWKPGNGPRPKPLKVGDSFTTESISGGKAVFWSAGVSPVDKSIKPIPVGEPIQIDEQTTRTVLKYEDDVELQGNGNFRLEFLLYQVAGVDLSKVTNATMATLELPPKIITPFLVMIFFSLLTKPNSKEALDRYYSKMKTPALKDREADLVLLEKNLNDLEAMEAKKLFPGTSLEFQKPTRMDLIGFITCFIICFAVIGFAILLAGIGA